MSVMERRLQLLLDRARYDRIAAEAERSGRTVSAVIREAIDVRFPDDGEEARMAAATRLLALTAAPDDAPQEEWSDYKKAYEDDLERSWAGR